MRICAVLRSGGDFDVSHVHALKRMLGAHMSLRYRSPVTEPEPGTWTFEYLSDCGPYTPGVVPLIHGWPGWWSKLELFRPGVLDGLTLFVDLDTLAVGDLAPFFEYAGGFAMLNDFNRSGRAQSGVMLIRPGPVTEAIWQAWTRDPEGHMRRYRGDGEWLHAHSKPDRLQDMFPGLIVSFKKHCRKAPPRGDVRLVCGHGRPRFSSRDAGWAHRLWTECADAGEAFGV